jgi:ClpP class serine protease
MWLMEKRLAEQIERARTNGYQPTADERARFNAFVIEARSAEGPRNLRIAGDVAEIRIEGVLTPKFDFLAWLFGGGNTTYADIQAALAMARTDDSIKRVVFYVDSPGGQVHGLFDTLAAIEAFPKPMVSRCAYACSAAYAIPAMAGKIEAVNPAVTVGSVGVVASYWVEEGIIDITSTEAPDKRPDPTTEEGQAVIRKHLDAIHELFVDAIARGRSFATGKTITVDTVNQDFGRGAVVLAKEAKRRGMIDAVLNAKPVARGGGISGSIAPAPNTETEPQPAPAAEEQAPPTTPELTAETQASSSESPPDPAPAPSGASSDVPTAEGHPEDSAPAADGGAQQERRPMDIKTLEKEHPELYQAVVQVGVDQERERVTAHLTMGKSHNALDVAFKAIDSGVTLNNQKVLADYFSAGRNAADHSARGQETQQAAEVTGGAQSHSEKGAGASPEPGGKGTSVIEQALDHHDKKKNEVPGV